MIKRVAVPDAPGLLVMKGWDADELTPQSVRQ
jgi:hypothetical protein